MDDFALVLLYMKNQLTNLREYHFGFKDEIIVTFVEVPGSRYPELLSVILDEFRKKCYIWFDHTSRFNLEEYVHLVWLSLQWRLNGHDGVSNHQPHQCLLNRLFRRRSKKTSKLRVTGLCAWNSPGTGKFPAQRASNAENFSIWLRHHVLVLLWLLYEFLCIHQMHLHVNGLVQDCGISSSLAMEILQSCTKPSI